MVSEYATGRVAHRIQWFDKPEQREARPLSEYLRRREARRRRARPTRWLRTALPLP